jgi:hypothetical protein
VDRLLALGTGARQSLKGSGLSDASRAALVGCRNDRLIPTETLGVETTFIVR